MAEAEEKKKKQASLDTENIPAAQRTESKKVSLDTEGVTGRASDAEKMSLDLDGVVVEKKGSSKNRKTSEDKKREAEQEADSEEKKQPHLVGRFRALPLKKIALIIIVLVLAASAAVVSYSYLMRKKESAGSDDGSKALTEQARDGDAQLQESNGQELPLELEPFIIALTNNAKTALLRITVLLQTRQCYDHHIINQKKTVRLAIYDILVKINAEEVLDSKRQEEIKSEILRKVNAIIGESIIEDVSFKDLVVA